MDEQKSNIVENMVGEPTAEPVIEPPVEAPAEPVNEIPSQTSYTAAVNTDTVSNAYQSNYEYNVGSTPSYIPPKSMDDSPMSMGDWILTILLTTFIPCVNIIMLCVWGFSSTGNINRRNYCRAMLIFQAISLVLSIIGSILIYLAFYSTFGGTIYY